MDSETVSLLALSTAATQRVIVACFITFIGGCIGSFLNVVVYRTPRGKSVVHPGSACPACGHEIRWYHNLPVVSWLLLRGRCHDCGVSISARYPLVEATVAVMFLALALTGPLSGDVAMSVLAVAWGAVVYRALVLCAILALALIELDNEAHPTFRYPWKWFVVLFAIGLFAPVAWPELRPALIGPLMNEDPSAGPKVMAIAVGLNGVLLGLTLGVLTWPASGLGPLGKKGRWTTTGNMILLGLFLNHEMAGDIAVLTGLVYFVAAYSVAAVYLIAARRYSIPWSLVLVFSAIVWIAVSTTRLGQPWLPVQDFGKIMPALKGFCLLGLSLLSWTTRVPRKSRKEKKK